MTGFNFNGKNVFVAKTGLKLGSKGKVTPAGRMYGMMNKGEARKLRKTLRGMGRVDLSAVSREAV